MKYKEYQEIEEDHRVYIVPVGTAFVPIGRQPKPDKGAVFAVGVGDDCPMLESRLCIGIDHRNLTYRCTYLVSYADKTNGTTVLHWVQCGYESRPRKLSVRLLKTTPNCDVDEYGCIYPQPNGLEELKRCKYLVGYTPSDLSAAHNHVVCVFLTSIDPE
jgi:hypothetical protein